jgi:hypothetical protein
MVTQFPVEQIEAGLANLRFRPEVRNPAGYLLRELQAGGYDPPAGRRGPQRPILYTVPTTSTVLPGAVEDPKETENRLQEAIEGLDEGTRTSWFLEARTQHARLMGKPVEKVPEDSILVWAAFENIVCERVLNAA